MPRRCRPAEGGTAAHENNLFRGVVAEQEIRLQIRGSFCTPKRLLLLPSYLADAWRMIDHGIRAHRLPSSATLPRGLPPTSSTRTVGWSDLIVLRDWRKPLLLQLAVSE